MVHLVKFIIAACLALLFGSCKYDIDLGGKKITGSGHVTSQDRNVKNFTKVEVSKGLDCEIFQDPNFKVTVEADDNLQEGITTKVENGTLVISSKYNNYRNVKSKKIIVHLPVIEGLEATSGSNLYTNSVIKGTDILVKSSSGSEIKAHLEADKIALEASSGSTLKAEGIALDITTDSSSGSSIEAQNLLANNVNAQSSSGSSTTVHPIVSLKAKASSGSSIDYNNTPKQIEKEESSGGSVSKE